MNKYLPSVRNKNDHEWPDTTSGIAGIFRNGWLISGVFVVVAALGIFYASTVRPVYEASIVLQLDRSSLLPGNGREEGAIATEIELLRSRSVLSAVAERLRLDISIEPTRHSFVEGMRTARFKAVASAGSDSIDEQLRVSILEVPNALLKQSFVLTANDGGRFTVTGNELAAPLDGTVGRLVQGSSPYGNVKILVAAIHSPPGAQFTLRRIPLLQATEQLQRSLVVVESGKQSNVMRATLQGAKPELLSHILNEIGSEYIHQRSREGFAKSEKVSGLFDRQLDESRQALREVDAHYATLLQRYGISDPVDEGQTVSKQSVALQSKLDETMQKKLELSSRLGERHPAMEAVDRQIVDLKQDLQRNEEKRKSLAAAERELSKVSQDRAMIREINAGLASQRAKLDTQMPSEHFDVRLIDRSETPVQALTLGFITMSLLSCFAGLILGVVASIVKNSFSRKNRMRLITPREARFRMVSMSRVDTSRGP